MANEKENAKAPGFDPSKINVVKHVTVATLSMKEGDTAYVRFTEAIHEGRVVEEKKPKDADKAEAMEKPADIALVENLQTGEIQQLIVSAVTKANLTAEYPKDSYIGKKFAITKVGKRAGKRYFDYTIVEFE